MKHSITLNAVLFLSSITFAQEARENKVISANLAGRAAGISIASENGNTSAIVYEDTGNQSIWACVSDGRGIIWNNPIRIDDDNTGAPKDTSESSLIVDGERIYIAWKDKRNGPNDDIFFTASEDSGATWLGANIRINDGFTPGDNDVKDFRIGSGGKDVIAICATNDGEEQLFLTYSNDGGASWSSAIDVTTHNGNADIDNIGMACENDIAYIVWRDNFLNGVDDTVWLSIFNFGSGFFIAQDINVSPNLILQGGDADDGVAVSVDDNYLAIMYHADNLGSTAEQLRINLSSDLGQTFLGDQKVGLYDNSNQNHDTDGGCVIVEDGLVALAWRDNRTGQDEVYATVGNMNTGIFSPDHLCSTGQSEISTPKISGEFSGEPLAISWSAGSPKVLNSLYYINNNWSDTFQTSNNTNDITNVRMTWNDTYKNFLTAYTNEDQGILEVWAGGYRAQQIDPGNPIAGNSTTFELSGFNANRAYQVVAARNLGNLFIPDGRNLGITYDNFTAFTRNLPELGGNFSSTGEATTSSITIPARISGTSMYLVAIAFNGSEFKAFSDPTKVTFQ